MNGISRFRLVGFDICSSWRVIGMYVNVNLLCGLLKLDKEQLF